MGKCDDFHTGPLDVRTFQMVSLNIQQHETIMVRGYNELIYGSFYDFSLIFIAFIDNHEYAFDNLHLICISDQVMKGLCLNFNLVSS